MNPVGLLDVVSTAAFLCALVLLLRVRSRLLDAPARFFLGTALAVYAFVGVSNVLEHLGITDALDRYEDYAEDLFIPFFLFALYSLSARSEIDRRVAAEAELRQSRERYRNLVENVDLGISLVGRNFDVLMANAAYGHFFGRLPGEFVGRKCYEVFEGRDGPCPDCPGAQALATRSRVSAEKDRRLPDGTEISVRTLAFPVFGSDGEAEAFIEILEDRTQRREADLRRRQMEARLLENERLGSLVTLAGGIAHDFNNLLMSVLGNTEMLLRKMTDDSPLRPYCKRVESSALRAAELTRQLSAYSGTTGAEFEPLSLGDLVAGMFPLAAAAAAAGTELRFDAEQGGPVVRGDADLLRQVLMILVLNASEALEGRPGTITLSVGTRRADRQTLAAAQGGGDLPEGTYACLEVADTGKGLEAGARKNLFDPFYSTKAEGRGLGLPAALGIVEAHGGAIAVASEPGRGTRFCLLLPTPGSEGLPPPRPPARPSRRATGRGRRRFLVVEREATVRTITRMALEDLGFRVLTVVEEQEARRALRERTRELAAAVVDASIAREAPGLLHELRAAEVPVLLSCGQREREEAASLGTEGFAGVLEKPFRRAELVSGIARALAPAGDRPREAQQAADQDPSPDQAGGPTGRAGRSPGC